MIVVLERSLVCKVIVGGQFEAIMDFVLASRLHQPARQCLLALRRSPESSVAHLGTSFLCFSGEYIFINVHRVVVYTVIRYTGIPFVIF